MGKRQEILAPAGDRDSFLAALAAGADAVYLGLKHFSARMEAENFGLTELARLTELAHSQETKVHVAMNTLLKPGDLASAWRLAGRLGREACVDALIIQDLALLDLARQAGFTGSLNLSTLANLSHPLALAQARAMGAGRVILPRELSIDEIRLMDSACPEGLELECFVQGALCYCVSGRCYWSSYLGGKSGLRGRCVQPCRRLYAKAQDAGRQGRNGQEGARLKTAQNSSRPESRPKNKKSPGKPGLRLFSCADLELGALVRLLLELPNIASWKIEGRKKGPHYVFHAVSAYRLLRDHPDEPRARKDAEELLALALGRPGTKARFLPQGADTRPMQPDAQTSSGLLCGKVRIEPDGACLLKPHFALLPGDYLRLGVEDERWHTTIPVRRSVPKGGSLLLRLQRHKTPKAGTPIFLIDRREPELEAILSEQRKRLGLLERPGQAYGPQAQAAPKMPEPFAHKGAKPTQILVLPGLGKGEPGENGPDMAGPATQRGARQKGRPPAGAGRLGRLFKGLWLSPKAEHLSPSLAPRVSWWLAPVVWPGEEKLYARLIKRLWVAGARSFVLNAPWQRAFFPRELPSGARLLAGPFCNTANACALNELKKIGFAAAFASPELSGGELLDLAAQSPLPLGLVLSGWWPVGISRFGLSKLKNRDSFTSPLGENFWLRCYGENVWLYPGWPLNLEEKIPELLKAGYSFFARLEENPPPGLSQPERPGLFNWAGQLL